MDDATRCLEAVERALLSAEPANASIAISALERLLAESPPASEEVDAYRGRIQRLLALSTSAADGAAAAHRWLSDALKLANSLETYTAAGRRSVDTFPARKADRY